VLARASLILGLMGLAGQSCIITGSPELDPPQRTAPILVEVSPATYQVQPVMLVPGAPPSASVSFTVISEDLGQPIQGGIYVDFAGWQANQRRQASIKPAKLPLGHLGVAPDQRHGTADFQLPTTPGCHTATLWLFHEFDFETNAPADTVKDTASATWYYFVSADPSTNPTIESCVIAPLPEASVPDAGAE
jgi:hypothetical protein